MAATVGGLALPLIGPAAAKQTGQDKKNVLFICIDDLNDWIGALAEQPAAHTPNIDKLAASGTLFRHAYCPAPACRPSRESTLRGILPYKSGVYGNPDTVPDWLKSQPSIPQLFRGNGYRTMGGGKVFHGSFHYRGLQMLGQQSAPWFDDYDHDATDTWDDYHEFEVECLPENPPLSVAGEGPFDWGALDAGRLMPDQVLAEWATSNLKASHERPFFMAVGFYKPHLPWHLPQTYFDLIEENLVKLPVNPDDAAIRLAEASATIGSNRAAHREIVDRGEWRAAIVGYLAAVAFVDEQVGKVLEALADGPNADDTHVVLWSDNGWHLGEKLRWKKFTLWEEATRVPLIIKPAGTAQGKICDHPVSVLDTFKTLTAMCDIPTSSDIDGHDLRPLLDDPGQAWPHAAISVWGPQAASLRQKSFRYTQYHNGYIELFDHRTDPGEWQNLAGSGAYETIEQQFSTMFPKNFAAATRGSRTRQRLRRATSSTRWMKAALMPDVCED